MAIRAMDSGQPSDGMCTESSTLESAVFTPWPPGPDEREKLQASALAGTVSDPVTGRSPNGS